MSRRLTVVLASMALLGGCASVQNYASAVRSWQGSTSSTLFRVWGYPDRISTLPNGHRLYFYRQRQRGSYPQFVNPGFTSVASTNGRTVVTSSPTTISGGGTYDVQCKTWFEVNKQGKVINTSFRGDGCVATNEFVSRHKYRH